MLIFFAKNNNVAFVRRVFTCFIFPDLKTNCTHRASRHDGILPSLHSLFVQVSFIMEIQLFLNCCWYFIKQCTVNRNLIWPQISYSFGAFKDAKIVRWQQVSFKLRCRVSSLEKNLLTFHSYLRKLLSK